MANNKSIIFSSFRIPDRSQYQIANRAKCLTVVEQLSPLSAIRPVRSRLEPARLPTQSRRNLLRRPSCLSIRICGKKFMNLRTCEPMFLRDPNHAWHPVVEMPVHHPIQFLM